MARILYGKEVSTALWERLLPRIDRLRAAGAAPTLAIVRVGERPDDLSYERTCARQADLHGIAVRRFVLPARASRPPQPKPAWKRSISTTFPLRASAWWCSGAAS